MRIKIVPRMVMLLILSLGLIGCSNSAKNKFIEKAKTSIENKEYDKALLSLEMALDEDSNNEEGKKLYNIVDEYQKSKKLIDENKIDEGKKILDEINSEYTNYNIKEDIDSLKSKVDNYYKEAEKVNDNSKGNSKVSESKKAEYIEKLNSIEKGLSDLDYLYSTGVTKDMLEAGGEKYKRWDNALNEIYEILKVELSKEDMDALTEKQIEWLDYRDTTAKNKSLAFEGGTMERIQHIESLGNLTKERCYKLVNDYMN